MFSWFKKKSPAPLTGAPLVRRQKTHSALSGYVYQYFYEGHRGDSENTEFVFEVCSDRVSSFAVSVFVSSRAVRSWEQGHGRELNGTEQYAIAKMALFQAFDDRATPLDLRQAIRVEADQVEAIVAGLGLDAE